MTELKRPCFLPGLFVFLKMKKKKRKNKKKFGWIDLFRSILFLVGDRKGKYVFLLFLLSLTLIYQTVPPIIIGRVVDFFTTYEPGDSLSFFYWHCIFLGGSIAVVAFFRLTIKKRLGNMRTDVVYQIRTEGFRKLIEQSLIRQKSENVGSKAQKVQNGVAAFLHLSVKLNNEILFAIASLAGFILVFSFLGMKYNLLLGAYVLCFFLIIKVFYGKLRRRNLRKAKAIESASGSYVEGLSNVLTIKSAGAEKSFRKHVSKKEKVFKDSDYKAREVGISMWRMFNVLNGAFLGVSLFVVGRDVVLGNISIGSIAIIFGYANQLVSPIATSFLLIYKDLIESKIAMERMMPIFSAKARSEKSENGKDAFPKNWQEIVIKNGNFSYKKKSKAAGVSDVNLRIKKHQKIGLVGKTGSGKSTLAKLLVGLYNWDKGMYKIGEENFRKIRKEELNRNLAIVLQESEMFNFSLKDNVTLMRRIKPELLKKAIKISQLESIIEKLPQGISTIIGEKGYHLSGGERQRVGIARAICRGADILIFDEATSSLDSRTEKLIQKSLESEFKKKTMIFVAHRISTLKNVDKIYVFKNGKIIEGGNYDELASNKNSEFSKLYISQKKS